MKEQRREKGTIVYNADCGKNERRREANRKQQNMDQSMLSN